jgi:hypothetical protein
VPITTRESPGWAARQSGSRGTSQRWAKALVAVTRSGRRSSASRTAETAAAKASKPARSTGKRRSPASVNARGRGRRRNSATAQASSSSRIWWLTAVGVTPSSAAAALKLMCRAAASKARSAVSAGILCLMAAG